MSRTLSRRARTALVLAALAAAPSAASAINIQLEYFADSAPSWDPNGAKLISMFQAAAYIWEQALPDDRTYNWDISWGYNADKDWIGLTKSFPAQDDHIRLNAAYTESEWFVDPTPLQNEEFTMTQTLWGPIHDGDPNIHWVYGNPPGLLEMGYQGSALGGSPAFGKADMLSVVVHEMGHALGYLSLLGTGDIHLDPAFTCGSDVYVQEDPDHKDHFLDPHASMYWRVGGRKCLSAVDICAVASLEGLTHVHLPRKDFAQGTGWFEGANWLGGAKPEAGDDVYVRHGGQVWQDGSLTWAQNLTVDANSAVIISDAAYQMTLSGLLTLGQQSTGTMAVTAGKLITHDASLGPTLSATGVAVITGPTASWSNTGTLAVGGDADTRRGNGTLTISNGATISTGVLKVWSGASVQLGTATLSAGAVELTHSPGYATPTLSIDGGTLSCATLKVTGGRLSLHSGLLEFSSIDIASGTLDWTNGTVRSLAALRVGAGQPAGSAWTVLGSNRRLEVQAGLMVGYKGSGAFSAVNGGQVTSYSGRVGYSAPGTISISGSDFLGNCSTWTVTESITVGGAAAGTLTIANGGRVSSDYGLLGETTGSGTVTIDGAGSSWKTEAMLIGQGASGNFTVQNGGVLSCGGSVAIGDLPGSDGTATFDGGSLAGSAGTYLYIGRAGRGTMSIRNGGKVSNAHGWVASDVGSTGVANIDGYGSTWTNTVDLIVGMLGAGQMNVTGGGRVTSPTGAVGTTAAGSVAISGTDGAGHPSTWDAGSALTIGSVGLGIMSVENGALATASSYIAVGSGHSGTLSIRSAGTVSTSGSVIIASQSAASGSRIDMTGAGSALVAGDILYVGNAGSGTLNVSGGAHVQDATACIGLFSGQNGTATVDGVGSNWDTTTSSTLGGQAAGTLTITNGGRFSSGGTSTVGDSADGRGNLVIDGPQSTFIAADLNLGSYGAANVQITHGGTLTSDNPAMCVTDTGTATVLVNGSGSRWNCGNGHFGLLAAGTLSVENGGLVYGSDIGTGHGIVNVAGSGSTLDGLHLDIGSTSSTLSITSGGFVNSRSDTQISQSTSSHDNLINISGSGSSLSAWRLYVGGNDRNAGGSGTVSVSDGGVAEGRSLVKIWGPGVISVGSGGTLVADTLDCSAAGATLLTAPGSTIRLSSFTGAGASQSFAGNLQIGYAGGSQNGTFSLSAGQTLAVGETLTVGYDRAGTLTQTGGTLTAGSVVIGSPAAYSQYSLSGGRLDTGTISKGSNKGPLAWTGGTLLFRTYDSSMGGLVQDAAGSVLLVARDCQVGSGGTLGYSDYSLFAGTLSMSRGIRLTVNNMTVGTGTSLPVINSVGTIDAKGTLTINSGTANLRNVIASGMSVGNGASAPYVTLASTAAVQGPVTVNSGTLRLTASQSFVSPTFAAGAKVILGANDTTLSLQDSTAPGAISPNTVTNIWTLVRSGYNGSAWNGNGIGSTAIAIPTLNGLGLALTGDPALETQTLTVREMILGDVNGDNKVTIGDVMVALNSANYQQDGTWLNGDVNYDGKVTIGDVMLMLNSTRYQQDYNPANAPAQIAALEAAGLGDLTDRAVPEPATLALLALGATGLLTRRHRARSPKPEA